MEHLKAVQFCIALWDVVIVDHHVVSMAWSNDWYLEEGTVSPFLSVYLLLTRGILHLLFLLISQDWGL